ncbi:VOC family protein [Nocardia sp. JMUB6875]|uniref:VOC family protein n=1 Tax=Nocardia sp. JMUB6875 TaxID=3158170 RepID=UPI0032E67779
MPAPEVTPTANEPIAEGAPCFIDLATSNMAETQAFYSSLFGWEYHEPTRTPAGAADYYAITYKGADVGAVFSREAAAGPADHWTTYFSTSDMQSTFARIEAAGGRRISGPAPMPGMGIGGSAIDPTGAAFGLWQAAGFTGYDRRRAFDTPGWHELLTRDFQGAQRFYEQALGWNFKTLDGTVEQSGFGYAMAYFPPAGVLLGVLEAKNILPDDVPDHWTPYFYVTDVDAKAAKATSLGGTVLRLEDVVGDAEGRLTRRALIADVTGASFSILKPNPQEWTPITL